LKAKLEISIFKKQSGSACRGCRCQSTGHNK